MNWLSSKASSHPLACSHHATTEVLRWYFLIPSQLCRSEEFTLSQENDWKFPILTNFSICLNISILRKQQSFYGFFALQKLCFYLAISMLSHYNICAFTLQNGRSCIIKSIDFAVNQEKNSSIILTLPTSFPSRTSNGADKNPTTDLYYSPSRLIFFCPASLFSGVDKRMSKDALL